MANTTISSLPSTVSEPDAVPVDSIVTIDAPLFKESQPREFLVLIKVTTGSFQFAVGADPGVSNPSIASTDEAIAITVSNSVKLHFLAGAQNDEFIISV